MGIDLLDLNFRIERKFDVSFSQDDYLGLLVDNDIVVGDLFAAILKKKGWRDEVRNNIGLNFEAWLFVQNLVQQATGVDLDQVQLGTPLAELFPKTQRRDLWQILRDQCHYSIPELDYPPAVRPIALTVAVAAAGFDVFHLLRLPGFQWLLPLTTLVGIWILIETYVKMMSILSRWRRVFPRQMRTVKDLCRLVLYDNVEEFCRDIDINIDRESVAAWRTLVEILCDTLGVDEDEVTPRARLVADLGME